MNLIHELVNHIERYAGMPISDANNYYILTDYDTPKYSYEIRFRNSNDAIHIDYNNQRTGIGYELSQPMQVEKNLQKYEREIALFKHYFQVGRTLTPMIYADYLMLLDGDIDIIGECYYYPCITIIPEKPKMFYDRTPIFIDTKDIL